MTDSGDSTKNYQVLARKYRPMTFEDMIGQEAMVKTLTNAFATGRVAHAFMLTGVRGIGKTTTARLLARALNYEGPHEGPSVKLDPPGTHCEAINKSSHMDVMEMDAASRTGVGDIREILDSVRYAPVSARYKVYIIDEVHMLSSAAFNALLKTLEEPPDHAKFIFATTEIRKIPITVLSRCQRFDLRRVEAAELSAHLKGICDKEGAKVSDEGLALISRAAEGSVRDGLSLLDQAIVQAEGSAEVDAEQIRSMLGLADRVRVFDLFSHAAQGDAKVALTELRAQYNEGAAPDIIIRDLLDCCHEISRAKVLGADAEYDAAPDQVKRLLALSEQLTMGQITRLWQLLLKSHDDVRRAPDPLAAAEMALLRMAVAGDLPAPELAAQLLEGLQHVPDGPPAAVTPTAAPVSRGSAQAQPAEPVVQTPRPAPEGPLLKLATLEELVASMPKTETELRYDMRRYIRPIEYEAGKLIFEAAPGAPATLERRLLRYLPEATNRPWQVEIVEGEEGAPSLMEAQKQAAQYRDAMEQNHAAVLKARELFPGVEIEFREIEPTSNVIKADFNKNEEPS
ncbi:MAG: DNA polymerase III subunit gamma/tau [Acidimicrobiales bacterium]|nr:DNA polymerase III subunit gamma/tau [Hyphomonadaceae bacterium]RZV44388.1 MAG: DNA polymerase III subunit gamma/tau [Acidimicrobiales bacterium]